MDPVQLLDSASKLTNRGPARRLVPSAAASLVILGVYVASRRPSEGIAATADFLSKLGAAQSILLVVLVAFASVLLQPFFGAYARLVSGYFPMVLRGIAGKRSRRLANRASRLQEQGRMVELARYPPRHMTLPTELGNVLRAADAYSEQRYGMDALVVLPRLLRAAPSEVASELRDLREDIQFASDLSGALALISGVSLALVAPAFRWDTHWWYAVPAVAALASWVSYRNAVTAAVAYGEAQRVVFDLQRWSLYEALRMAPPRSSEEEREVASRLSEFFWFGSPIPEVHYGPPPPADAS